MEVRGHTKLIGATEYTFAYLNKDRTKTIYVFTAPLEKEVIRIKKLENDYLGTGNYFSIKMPMVFSKDCGINVGGNIDILPTNDNDYKASFKERQNVFGQKKDCIVYKDFYDGHAEFHCYVTGFGLNTEIVIPEYTGNNSFQIKIREPEMMFAIEDSPDYVLLRTEDYLKAIIYTPLAVDADGKRTYKNSVNVTKDYSDDSCNITYTINQDFLSNSNTKYPVTLNQSIYAYVHKQSDTAIYSETGDTGTHHLSPYMLLGDKTMKGEGWGFVRFEELYGMNISADQVISVDYNFKNLFDNDKEVIIGAHAIRNDWCSVNTRWRTKPGYDNIPVKTVKVKERGVYSVDITKLFIEMMSGNAVYEPPYSVRNSFFIKSLTKDTDLLLAAGDSGIFSPYLKIILKAD